MKTEDCEDSREQLIQEIKKASCEKIFEEKKFKKKILELDKLKFKYLTKFIASKLPTKYPKSIYETFKILYDSKPLNLNKIFFIKACKLDYKKGLKIHLAEVDEVYELIFEEAGKFYLIDDKNNLSHIADNNNAALYIQNYDEGIGQATDQILKGLTFDKELHNTRIIEIPYQNNFDLENISDKTFIEFYPAVSANNKLRFSLMTRLVDLDATGTIQSDPDFSDWYYDDFCLKPPGC